MAGFISDPRVGSPKDAWALWREAVTLANAGESKLAARLVQDVLGHPGLPHDLQKMAEERQRQGWTRPRQTYVLDRDGPLPF